MTRAFSCTLLALILVVGCGDSPPPRLDPAPTVLTARLIRGEATTTRDSVSAPIEREARIETGATLATDSVARLLMDLDAGGFALLDRDSSLLVSLETLTLSDGRLWLDLREGNDIAVVAGEGRVLVADAAASIAIVDGGAEVYCARGELRFVKGETEDTLSAGERVVLGAGEVDPRPVRVWDDWTGGLADPAPEDPFDAGPIGALRGRTENSIGVAHRDLSLRSHEVRTSIQGDYAITEVVQTFFNGVDATLEGEWRMRIPEEAILRDFAVDTGHGSLIDAAVGTLSIGDGYAIRPVTHIQHEARLAWDGPGRLRARVRSIAPGQVIRVRVRYGEWIPREGDTRRYRLPLHGTGPTPLVGELTLDIDTTASGAGALRSGLGAELRSGHVVFRESDARPSADFVLDLVDAPPAEGAESPAATARGAVARVSSAYAGDDADGFVMFEIPTSALDIEPPSATAPLSLVIVVDVSGDTGGEDLELARATVEALLSLLGPEDRVALRFADIEARVPEGMAANTHVADDETRQQILEAVARAERGGATDLGQVLADATRLLAGAERGAVLYIGDGRPTTGALTATAIREAIASVDSGASLHAVAIGEDAHESLLGTLVSAPVKRVRDRAGAHRVLAEALAEITQPRVAALAFDAGPGVERVLPALPRSVPFGGTLRFIGRLRGSPPSTLTLTGVAGGEAFERTLPVRRAAHDDALDLARRWARDRARQLLDEGAGREAMVALGMRYRMLTPWTSFYVAGPSVFPPELRFDHGYRESLFGAATTGFEDAPTGWRRRFTPADRATTAAVESSFVPWLGGSSESGPSLGQVAIRRVLRREARVANLCVTQRRSFRPELAGNVSVTVVVNADGSVASVEITIDGLGDAEAIACIREELAGLAYPALGARVSVSHRFAFPRPAELLVGRRVCSEASRHSLAVRRRLWDERKDAASANGDTRVSLYRAAERACELPDWRARRTMLRLLLDGLSVQQRVVVHQRLESDAVAAVFLEREILRGTRTVTELAYARRAMGLDESLDRGTMARAYAQASGDEAKIRLLERWLEVLPEDLELQLALMERYEAAGRTDDARRVARRLASDPLADATVRTRVGELYLRLDDRDEARRVFSALVERHPRDPWARRRLADLYRAHRYFDEAYREYLTLARLRPNARDVTLLIAQTAAAAGRVDEAIRIEEHLAEEAPAGLAEGVAALARASTVDRLTALLASDDATLRERAGARLRRTGFLRRAPERLVVLRWSHPDDALALELVEPGREVRVLETAHGSGGREGIALLQMPEMSDREIALRVRRGGPTVPRGAEGALIVIDHPGTPEASRREVPITLEGDTREQVVPL